MNARDVKGLKKLDVENHLLKWIVRRRMKASLQLCMWWLWGCGVANRRWFVRRRSGGSRLGVSPEKAGSLVDAGDRGLVAEGGVLSLVVVVPSQPSRAAVRWSVLR